MKPFTLTLGSEYHFVSQLEQLDFNLPSSFEIDGDRLILFNLTLELQYEHLQEHPELLQLFRRRSDLSRSLGKSTKIETLLSLSKLVGRFGEPVRHYLDRIAFSGIVPYNPYNLEIFLEYFRN